MEGEKKDLLAYIREGREMTQGEKLNLIIQLSIPSILAQISTVLMFFIDAAMVGHLGARQAASIGLVESASWLFAGLTSSCSMGFSVQVAHAIGADASRLAGGGEDIAPGTHAEGVGTAAGGQVDTEGVICRGQTIEFAAVLGKAHIPLQMLDAGAHGEGFALHGDTGGIEIFKGVTGGVPDGQNSLPAGDELPAVFTRDLRTAQDSVFRPELLQPGAEADLPAQGEDLFPDALHHAS